MFNLFSSISHRSLASARFLHAGIRLAVAGVAAGTLGACAQAPKSMYDWQSYQPAVYAYLNDDGMDYVSQAQTLEQNIETARSANTALPPGFRAHLGMLYLKMGQAGKAMEQLEGEKRAFPEATPFMEFLMRNASPAAGMHRNTDPASDAAAPKGGVTAPSPIQKKGV